MTDQAAVTVIGIGDDGWTGLTDEARTALRGAPVIAGAARHLALLPGPAGPPGPAPRRRCCPSSTSSWRTHPACACWPAGTPCCTGSARRSRGASGPGRSACSPRCPAWPWPARGWAGPSTRSTSSPWCHGRSRSSSRPCSRDARVIVLCRDGSTPAALAALLADRGWGGTQLTVLEHLGGEREQVRGPYPAGAPGRGPFADLSVVALACVPDSPGRCPAAGPRAARRCLRERRAAHPPRGQGAGPGRARPRPRPAPLGRRARAAAASASSGCGPPRAAGRSPSKRGPTGPSASAATRPAWACPASRWCAAQAPGALAGLPAPDAVFVGRRRHRRRRARHVLGGPAAAAAGWSRTRSPWSPRRCCTGGSSAEGGELVKLALSYAAPLGGFTTWRPALPVTQWQVTRP